ncbi:pilus (MSHA type) biogenesis protein MshL [Thauera aromatica]|uniref:pilus (MSHA type) biogenesis protein MshL n=1 Tax=Thauera aromatica TaxID=59405 RepID=UPI001FFDC4A3|nr:pilus (MSHA type) biogenesis protein MshL [Thauera aromatica]MCK2089585.1 pilus (MSHA type) biogenesis protein MshL [Thauera aromatica]
MTPWCSRPALAALALLLAACAGPRPAPGTDSPYAGLHTELAAHRAAEKSGPIVKLPPELPPEAAASLLPPLALELPKAPERRFDIDVREVDARTFFMSLLHDSAENIVVHPAVAGTLTLSLRNVTVADVLASVSDVYGYDVRRGAAGWQVFPAALQSRMFNVNYINLNRDGRTETRVSSGQLRGGNGAAGSSDSTGSTSSGRDAGNPASSQIETTSSSKFWSELEQSLRLIVGVGADIGTESSSIAGNATAAGSGGPAAPNSSAGSAAASGDGRGGRAVVVNPHTGLVLVRGMPAELREVESFLQSLQDSVTRQVLLEAKILEVELSDGFQTGINWAALGKPGSGKSIVGGMTGGGQFFSQGSSEIRSQTGVLNPAALQQIDNTLTSAFGGVFSVALNLNDFTAFIELLKSQGDVQVLSSPRISTMNNQKAVIKVGSDEFFVTRVSSNNTTTGTTTTTTPEIELTPFFSGIALDVTPQIDAAGEVILHVRPAVSEVVDQTKTLTVFGQEQRLPLAFSSMRESDSIVRAKNGQIIVIGGLMQDVQRDNQAGLPVLGDLPGIGHLFRHTQKSRRKSELVILLKPVVVDNGLAWQDDLRGATDRIDGFFAPRPARR